ncbi:MFS transporter [Methanocalculus taiwanensis]|uniref:MFS transporter n=1 Tax=Methanocalculus taiwanensis TaxID=106207 RepID=A0ABD4TK10_9EURY|nr:MFS transporter [Methanocalculus taiwanensis]MCQ1537620.1 MFS transporter [Methanocalculus taiwanensis]
MTRRVSLRIIFIAVFASMLGLGIVVPLLPYYADALGATGIGIGLIFSGFALSRAVFMPLIGRYSDRKGRKYFILIGLGLFAILSVAYIFASSVAGLTLIRIAHGFASAMVVPVAMAYVADFSPPGKEGIDMGSFNASLFLGLGCGPLIGGAVLDSVGIEMVFLLMAALSGLAFVICLAFLPEAPTLHRKRSSIRLAAGSIHMKPILFFRIMNAYANGTFMVFLPVIAIFWFHLTAFESGIIISMSILATGFLQRTFGGFADRFSKTGLIVIGTVIVSLCLIIIPFSSGFFGLFVVSFILGIGSALAIPASTAVVVIAGREFGQGACMGAFNTAMSVGMVTAPIISGHLMDILDIRALFEIAGAISLLSAFLFLIFARRAGIDSYR